MPSCQGMEEAQLSFAKHLGVLKTSSLPNATGESEYFSRLAESVLIAKGTKVERRVRFQGGAFEV